MDEWMISAAITYAQQRIQSVNNSENVKQNGEIVRGSKREICGSDEFRQGEDVHDAHEQQEK